MKRSLLERLCLGIEKARSPSGLQSVRAALLDPFETISPAQRISVSDLQELGVLPNPSLAAQVCDFMIPHNDS
jgi:hypothetical protein